MPVRMASGDPASTACSSAGVGAVELDERPGERAVERLARPRLGLPRPRGHGAGGGELDQLGELVAGDGVVLDGRADHPAVRAPNAQHEPFAQPRQERALDRTDRPGERVFEHERRRQDPGLGHATSPTGLNDDLPRTETGSTSVGSSSFARSPENGRAEPAPCGDGAGCGESADDQELRRRAATPRPSPTARRPSARRDRPRHVLPGAGQAARRPDDRRGRRHRGARGRRRWSRA